MTMLAASPLSTAKRLGKAAARELLPPIIHTALRRALRPATGLLGVSSVSKTEAVLTSGQIFHHRGTPADRGVIDQIFRAYHYDLRKLRHYPRIAKFYEKHDHTLIVDCGANIGASPLWLSHTYPKSTVVAVEPDPANYSLMARNCPNPSLVSLHGAVASKSGSIALIDPGQGEWGYRTTTDVQANSFQVRAYTIDEIVESRMGTPFILKVDIEGAEGELFSASSAAIDRFPVVVIELHDWLLPGQATSRSFLKWHSSHNRDFVYVGENVFSISNDIL